MSEWLDFVESCGLEPTGDIDRVAKRMGGGMTIIEEILGKIEK